MPPSMQCWMGVNPLRHLSARGRAPGLRVSHNDTKECTYRERERGQRHTTEGCCQTGFENKAIGGVIGLQISRSTVGDSSGGGWGASRAVSSWPGGRLHRRPTVFIGVRAYEWWATVHHATGKQNYILEDHTRHTILIS